MFGDHLRRTRLSQRRTLADVARTARVSLPYLSEVERGRKEASSEVLAAICDALGISLADLLIDAGTGLVAWQLGAPPLASPRALLGQAGQDLAGPAAPAAPGCGTAQATCLLAA
jgi:XRE family transcriptional regulator, stress-response regulator